MISHEELYDSLLVTFRFETASGFEMIARMDDWMNIKANNKKITYSDSRGLGRCVIDHRMENDVVGYYHQKIGGLVLSVSSDQEDRIVHISGFRLDTSSPEEDSRNRHKQTSSALDKKIIRKILK